MSDAAAVAALRAGRAPWVVVQGEDEPSTGDAVVLPDDVHHHLVRARRQRDGDEIVVVDGAGTVVDGVLDGRSVQVRDVHRVAAGSPRLRIAQAMGRRSKHDEVVRMLTEVGVDHVTAVSTRRCQVELGSKVDRVRSRWRAIAMAACTQSRRAFLPVLDGPVSLDEVLGAPAAGSPDADGEVVLTAHPGVGRDPAVALAAKLDQDDATGPVSGGAAPTATVIGVVGPEGGLTDDEVAMLGDAGAVPVSLGPSVLRTEHAALALAAVLSSAMGRMHGS